MRLAILTLTARGSARIGGPPAYGKGVTDVRSTRTAQGVVALFNASDDTIDMVQKLLTASGRDQILIWCHFADLKKGIVDFGKYMEKHNPEVVIFDLSPPYDENWHFFKTMRDAKTMQRARGGPDDDQQESAR